MLGQVDPASAADDEALGIALALPGVRGRALHVGVGAIDVLAPFGHVAGHLIKAESIGLQHENIHGAHAGLTFHNELPFGEVSKVLYSTRPFGISRIIKGKLCKDTDP